MNILFFFFFLYHGVSRASFYLSFEALGDSVMLLTSQTSSASVSRFVEQIFLCVSRYRHKQRAGRNFHSRIALALARKHPGKLLQNSKTSTCTSTRSHLFVHVVLMNRRFEMFSRDRRFSRSEFVVEVTANKLENENPVKRGMTHTRARARSHVF